MDLHFNLSLLNLISLAFIAVMIVLCLLSIRAEKVRVFTFQNQFIYKEKLRRDKDPEHFTKFLDFVENSPGFYEILLSRKRIKTSNFYTKEEQQQYFA
ncbi:hypothetical protein [Nonlabens agnitus]|uniref:Uncharacterized protein n=1 Tax=Nonlabens agnitus TaxID=870484 RepID=A0A2S9WXC7_9FLAO|nr:hypothetical protein [Nonlabens agnitus]PRP68124.1 hypothetical protein BST86_14015 [Nonlabens agnitus]